METIHNITKEINKIFHMGGQKYVTVVRLSSRCVKCELVVVTLWVDGSRKVFCVVVCRRWLEVVSGVGYSML